MVTIVNFVYGVLSGVKTAGGGATIDIASVTASTEYCGFVLDITIGGTGVSGQAIYYIAKRYVITAGGATYPTTIGTDATSNCTLAIAWVSGQTFKISVTNTLAGGAGIGFSIAVSGGGANNAVGYLTSIIAL